MLIFSSEPIVLCVKPGPSPPRYVTSFWCVPSITLIAQSLRRGRSICRSLRVVLISTCLTYLSIVHRVSPSSFHSLIRNPVDSTAPASSLCNAPLWKRGLFTPTFFLLSFSHLHMQRHFISPNIFSASINGGIADFCGGTWMEACWKLSHENTGFTLVMWDKVLLCDYVSV